MLASAVRIHNSKYKYRAVVTVTVSRRCTVTKYLLRVT